MIRTSLARKLIPSKIRKPLRRLLYARVSPERQRGKGYVQLRAFLNSAQWWDAEQIRAWQLEKLQATVRHAYEQVPGYYMLYAEAGVTPSDIRSLEDIRLLPVIDKETLCDNLDDFTARDVPSWRRWPVQTSGSSGMPMHFYHDDASDCTEDAFIHASWERGGWRSGDTVALMTTKYLGTKAHFWDYDRARGWIRLSVYQLERDNVGEYIDQIKRVHANHLYGASSTVMGIADHIIGAGLVGSVEIKSVLLGSEVIEEWHKARLLEAFPGARIMGWYGHSERAILASWCETSDNYHVWPFYGYTELLDGDQNEVGQGESGRLVGTSFWSQATPFIRYDTEDSATRGADLCPSCGRKGMLLERVDGRVRDMLIAADGRQKPLPPSAHGDLLRGVEHMQYYQDTPGKVALRLVVTPGFSEQDRLRLQEDVGAYFCGDLELEIQLVSEIERTAAGKHRVLDQRIATRNAPVAILAGRSTPD